VVVFGARDSRDLDRALVQRYFPDALKRKAPPEGELWLLFTHDGEVVERGEEPLSPLSFPKTLEARYPGIHTAESTLASVVGVDGKPLIDATRHPLKLECVWLSADSPVPEHQQSDQGRL
jgi:hypothetical protein